MTEVQTKRSSLVQRVITGSILAAALVVVLIVGGWLFALAVFVCLSIALHEELNALCAGGHYPVRWPSYVVLAISVPLMMSYSSVVLMPVLAMLSFGALLAVLRREKPDLVDVCMSVLPMLTVALPGMCLFGILDTQPRLLQSMLLSLVFIIAVGGDTFAYFVGSAVGGPKLCPRISPNKTVAGAIGGLFGSVLCAIALGRIFAACAADPSIFPPVWADALVGLLGGLAGQVGDLFASLVKRHCKIKDFGSIFPGHGGMLDRLDSVLFTAIAVYCYKVILLSA